nr:uncharacterized PE-PGRS family protein PE_PGRS54-like [Drosophila suzukii]
MACPLARGGGRGATAVGGTGGGFVGGATHPQIRGRGAQPEERGWGRAMRAIPSAVVARGTTHSPLRGGVAHRRRSRRRSTVCHAAVEAGPATHAAIHGATATGGADAKRGVDRAADATTAEGGSPPGTGGGAVGGADGGAGRAREHTGVRGRGRTVAAADADMDVTREAREAQDRADEGGAQDMGGGGTQGEPSGLPDEKPTGCVGSADTKHGPANTGDDGAESLEKGPWVWPEPPATQRPPLQRQASTPGSTRPRPQFMRQVSAPEEGGWREVARSEWPEGIEEALAVATARRKGGRRCVLVCEGGRRYRVRLGVAGIGVFTQ